jgi:hypothetical protein
MSDLHDPSIMDVEAVPAGQAASASNLAVAAQPGPDAVPQVEPAVESEDLRRFRERRQSTRGEAANGAESSG